MNSAPRLAWPSLKRILRSLVASFAALSLAWITLGSCLCVARTTVTAAHECGCCSLRHASTVKVLASCESLCGSTAPRTPPGEVATVHDHAVLTAGSVGAIDVQVRFAGAGPSAAGLASLSAPPPISLVPAILRI